MSHDLTDAAELQRTLDAILATAAGIGVSDRDAGSVSRAHHEAHLVSESRLDRETEVRCMSVLGDIGSKVRQAVAISMRWEDDLVVPVMHLTAQEYPGRVPRWPSEAPAESLDPALLRFAGRRVFDLLAGAGRKPFLKYVYNGDIRVYELHIAVAIKVSELTGVEPCDVPEHIRERDALVAAARSKKI